MPPGVHTIDHLMTPEDNLAVQTAVVAHATAFVGTYGGFSYLAPFLASPRSASAPSRRRPSHGTTSSPRDLRRPRWGDFVALRHTDLALVELVTRGLQTRVGRPT